MRSRRVLVTRPVDHADDLARLLAERGLEPVTVPTVAVDVMTTRPALTEMLRGLQGADWLVLTSANGARALSASLDGADLPPDVRVAAVGPATADALRDAGIEVDHVPKVHLTVAIAEGLGDVSGRRVVLARADAATPDLRDALVERGARVEEVVAYRTIEGPAASTDGIRTAIREPLGGIAFTSGSTVRGLIELVPAVERDRLRRIPAFCIGPVTADVARQNGFDVAVVAQTYTALGLADAIASHHAREDRMTLLSEAATAAPTFRGRRLRRTPALRDLVRETRLHPAMLVAPIFVRPGSRIREEIGSMPGQHRLSLDELPRETERLLMAGVRSVLLFGLPGSKDAEGSGAWADDGIVQSAIRELRRAAGSDLAVIADVCLCEYTSHGHCGVLRDGGVDNDATLPLLGRAAASLAEAGADVVAPSAMMDGQVAAIRAALDTAGRPETAVLAYAAKHGSAFYGPFREAADSAPAFGDRRSYQMDPANGREAVGEILADVAEGADLVMVKPALPALDLVAAARAATTVPIAAYQVSGEYAAIVAAAERGWLDRRAAALESLTGIVRAGAGIVVTYFAAEAAPWIRDADR